MAERDEVEDGLLDAGLVVHSQVAHVHAGLPQVEEDHRDLAPRQLADQLRVQFRGHDDDARQLALDEAADVVRGALRVVVRVRQHEVVAALEGRRLD